MLEDILILAVGLVFILFAAELFTNAVEYIGDKLDLSKNFTGSVLAAVGTALPESILPIIAILFFGDKSGDEIGIGAILGAPFMLSTLAFPLIGLTAIVGYLLKKRDLKLNVEEVGLRRDIVFFLFGYSIALFLVPLETEILKPITAVFLLILYVLYVILTLKGESGEMEEVHHLYLAKGKIKESLPVSFIQLFVSLALMITGAHIFVEGIGKLSSILGISPLIFSLLLAPVATELPEKINSVLWILRGKDTLAVGNVSGAMVFQSTIPVSIGILLTDWNLDKLALASGVLAIVASFIVLIVSYFNKRFIPFGLSIGIIFYLIYIYLVISAI